MLEETKVTSTTNDDVDATKTIENNNEGSGTSDDKKASKASKEVAQAKYTDDDVDAIINQKFAKWQREQEAKISEAAKLAEMNATEKAEFERDNLQKELEELKRASTIAEMEKLSRKMLAENNVSVPDSIVSSIVTEDAETTKNNVTEFSKAFNAAVQDAVKEALKGKTPTSGGTSTLSKEDIMKVSNRAERQRLINENIKLFQ